MARGLRGKLRALSRLILDGVAGPGSWAFLPWYGAAQRRENASKAFAEIDGVPQHLLVEDNGSDTTLFSFSSAALLHSGLPTFEFTGFLRRLTPVRNLVFFRDVHRLAYHVTPKGEPDGLAFYEQEVRRAIETLGSTRNVAIGDSSGAAAAIYFGTRCGMDKVVAFSPSYPMGPWVEPLAKLREFVNVRELLTDPRGYWETLALTWFSTLVYSNQLLHVGREGVFDPMQTFLECQNRPRVTLVYGERCRPDRTIAKLITDAPEVKAVPLPTGRHMLWMVAARSGGLEEFLAAELQPAPPGT